jgi:xanthine dehydrogenase molybdopterin-binding subunit B
MSIHFKNERERNFYDNGKDMDFVRYHKRVSKNFLNGIQELLDTSKQTIARGIAQ